VGTYPTTPAQRDAQVETSYHLRETRQISQGRWSPASTIGAEP
jgi:hypothetical protein